ncbi:glycoside hydrolase family 65 protein [Qaidamihabitans albus]|uniref:glycoside hydrolase family 65 protein n=1 Tax=Qaidamihabitans albus TaxID=2795733 RepID=UPI0018F1CBA5|nr:glycoside hydrolase family 65 protein [Qaidamihabitans albus]
MTAVDDLAGPREDPAWTVQQTTRDPVRRRVDETLFTLGAGGYATRGAVEESPGDGPAVLVAGVYTGTGPRQRLLPGPDWTQLDIAPAPVADRRVLDLRSGVLVREELGAPCPVRTLRFVSAHRPGVMVLRAEAATTRLRAGAGLRPPGDEPMSSGSGEEGRCWARVGGDAGITAVAIHDSRENRGTRTVERFAAYGTGGIEVVEAAVEAARRVGFDRLLAEHRAVWADRWAAVDVRIPDDPDVQLTARFALFQLWCNVGGQGEAAVGARGLSGHGYAGHVFWDADVFVLPAVVSMDPALALAMVDYRVRRLPAARAAARAAGYRGARFPWESAADGHDVTPTSGDLGGQPVVIKTGTLEEHITADVAWAAWHCAQWTSQRRFLRGRRRALLIDTARYWASRVRLDRDGHGHLEDVIGPDEYHESVTDNAYTNVMARWNLRTAADLVGGDEGATFRGLAAKIVDGHDAATGLYEQFAGYFGLEPLLIADLARPPVAADVLLGPQRIAASQISKQPDVLMLHHLVPDETAPGTLRPNLDFYLPRTAHGSSLSPGITASLLARAGQPDEALRLLRIALRLDLDDLTGTTAAGLHLATIGSAWQALLFGFAGVRVRRGVLHLDPALPSDWGSLGVSFCCLGHRVRLDITRDVIDIDVDAPLRVCLRGSEVRSVTGHARLPTGRVP